MNTITPAEMVYGQVLRFSGEFLAVDDSVTTVHSTMERKLKEKLKLMVPLTAEHKCRRKPFVTTNLKSASHVFIRYDAVKKPLQMPYDGPFNVVERSEKFFKIIENGKERSISIDRLKHSYYTQLNTTTHIHLRYPVNQNPLRL